MTERLVYYYIQVKLGIGEQREQSHQPSFAHSIYWELTWLPSEDSSWSIKQNLHEQTYRLKKQAYGYQKEKVGEGINLEFGIDTHCYI